MMQRLNEGAKTGAVNFRCAPRELIMSRDGKKNRTGLTRRETLTGAAATLGVGLAAGRSASAGAEQRIAATLPSAKMCILTPEAVEGPFVYMAPYLEHGIKARPEVVMLLTMVKGVAPAAA